MKFGAFFIGVLLLVPLSASAQTLRPTCAITVTPGSIPFGGSVTIKWTSSGATSGAITNVGNVAVPSGQKNIIPTRSTTYVGSFSGPGGTANCSASVLIISGGIDSTGVVEGGGAQEPVVTAPAQNPTIIVPSAQVSGTTGALVPCSGLDCQLCSFSKLAQNIINFLVGLSIPLAIALLAYAGVLYYTSGAIGGEENIKKAKQIFKSIAYGFVVIIVAFLVVQTALRVVLAPGYYQSWNSIQCVAPQSRPMSATITQWLQSLPGISSLRGTGSNTLDPGAQTPASFDERFGGGSISYGAGGSCPEGYTYTENATEYWCQDSSQPNNPDAYVETSGPDYIVSGGGAATSLGPGREAWMQTLSQACQQFNNCNLVNRITGRESGWGANCTTSNTGAVGCMQVLSTTACSVDSGLEGCSTCRNSAKTGCSLVAQQMADDTRNAYVGSKYVYQLQTMPILQKYRDQYGECQITAAAYFQGPGNVLKYGGIPPAATSYVAQACR